MPETISEADVRMARESGRRIAAYFEGGRRPAASVRLDGEDVPIPPAVALMLADFLGRVGETNGGATEYISAEKAADLLNVSKQFVDGLVTEGALPSRGGELPLQAVLEWKRGSDARSQAALDELTALDQEWGLP